MLKKADIVQRILKGKPHHAREKGSAFAPANIALCKYWGKRDEELNLPVTSSFSISLGPLGSKVTIRAGDSDAVELNGKTLEPTSSFARRTADFLDLFRSDRKTGFRVSAENTIPTAAGFASSASGFAALTLALNELFGWGLDRRSLSILARLGSGSACRSLFDGFVEWHAGTSGDGMDSFAEEFPARWPNIRMGLIVISGEAKAIGSRSGMKHTVETSPLYAAWPATVASDLVAVKDAIRKRDVAVLGQIAEANAMAMHATMIASRPAVLYWKPESITAMQKVISLRETGVPVYFTMDAGPNLKLIFPAEDEPGIRRMFPDVQVVAPFGAGT